MTRFILAALLPFVLVACAGNPDTKTQDMSFAFEQRNDDEPIASARGPGQCALFADSIAMAEAKLDR
jgi:hypothetical protein